MKTNQILNFNLDQIENNITLLKNILINIEENINNIYKLAEEKINNTKDNNFSIGNIKSLKTFINIADFNNFTENLYNIKSWNIRKESYKERAETLKKYQYWTDLKNLFNDQELINRYLTNGQLVSFFDTMFLMHKALNNIQNETIKNEMNIIMEYRIPVPSKPRVDYVLTFRNNIILIEFSKEDNSNNLAKTSDKKIEQLNKYKQYLNTSAGIDSSTITCLPIIYMSETTEENIKRNNESLEQLNKSIKRIFGKQKNIFEILKEIL